MKTVIITAYDHDSTRFIGEEINIDQEAMDVLKERDTFLESIPFRKWHFEVSTNEILSIEQSKFLDRIGLMDVAMDQMVEKK